MINPESKRPVTIEDLLRLKRAEHPPAEFWTEFDQELRAKQLSALVEKRPWWRSLPRSFRGIARYHLPLGATAVLALTLLTIRDYRPGLPTVANPASVEPANSEQPANLAPEVATNQQADIPANVVTPAVQSNTPPAPTMTLSSDATAPGELARMVPMLPAENFSGSHVEFRPSARSIAQNLAVAEVMLGTPTSSFEMRALPARATPQEPLAQMANPAETRRSRFAAAFAAVATDSGPSPSVRIARRLSDEQLYDSIHRFGANGTSVSFRF